MIGVRSTEFNPIKKRGTTVGGDLESAISIKKYPATSYTVMWRALLELKCEIP